VFKKTPLLQWCCGQTLSIRGEFHRFAVTVQVSRVRVRIRARFSFSERVGIGLPDME